MSACVVKFYCSKPKDGNKLKLNFGLRAKSVGRVDRASSSDAQGSRLEPGSTSTNTTSLPRCHETVSIDIGDQGLVDQKIFAIVKLVQLSLQATSKNQRNKQRSPNKWTKNMES